ncbi:uncharacterized protein NPIL_14741 [Nephila pilipes]|uniref:Mutator-like transposase domain-containing protein n=1 Tax=Nephila pilipes TaxID=299642 RepID=A0A8X6Q669_NEPPI|nr:uncharacterized protein NPIL_14741 [Nephila pilipes]
MRHYKKRALTEVANQENEYFYYLPAGFVIDYEIMSKRCIECEYGKPNLGENSVEYNVCYESYLSSCFGNHVRSSCKMEQEAALKFGRRSKDIGFPNTTLLSDGDAKTYQYLYSKEVNGPEFNIKKEE